MFGLGMQEIIVIGVLALLLLGPRKLPELAQTVGKFVRDFQRAADEVKREITTPVNEIKSELKIQAGIEPGEPDPPPRGSDPSAGTYGITADQKPQDDAATAEAPAGASPETGPPCTSKHAG